MIIRPLIKLYNDDSSSQKSLKEIKSLNQSKTSSKSSRKSNFQNRNNFKASHSTLQNFSTHIEKVNPSNLKLKNSTNNKLQGHGKIS